MWLTGKHTLGFWNMHPANLCLMAYTFRWVVLDLDLLENCTSHWAILPDKPELHWAILPDKTHFLQSTLFFGLYTSQIDYSCWCKMHTQQCSITFVILFWGMTEDPMVIEKVSVLGLQSFFIQRWRCRSKWDYASIQKIHTFVNSETIPSHWKWNLCLLERIPTLQTHLLNFLK